MFFIFGVNSDRKEIGSFGPVICGCCGRYGRYQVYMTCMCLSLFFIPVFRWGRKYYVETSCCQSLYELDPQAGRRLQRGEQTEIRPEEMTLIRRGGSSSGSSGWGWASQKRSLYCPACGYETEEDFKYCPRCGRELEER